MPNPLVALGPTLAPHMVEAIESGGGQLVPVGPEAEALVWAKALDVDGLRQALSDSPHVRWVQLPLAGIERVAKSGLFHGEDRLWTCAKGAFAEPVAEHAVMLALAGLRVIYERVGATTWGAPKGTELYDAPITILGGGGITEQLLRLLAPWRVQATVVRRQAKPVAGAARTVSTDQLLEVLPGSLVVFLALALTPATARIIDAQALAAMGPQAWLVNVARGGNVDTDALVDALRSGAIAGAALDVTDPEPLPDGHPLWSIPNCIITPHTADTPEMVEAPLLRRIRENVAHFGAGEPLVGLIDAEAGY